MDEELKKIFESIDSNILTEDVLGQMSKMINEKIEKAVNQRVTLEVESALKTQNEDHGQKFKRIVEAIDVDHTNKVKKVVEAINKKHIGKLLTIKEKYDIVIKETAVKHRDALVESVNTWIDNFLAKNLPREQIAEAAKNKYIENVLAEARQVLSVDSGVIKENVKSALKDGKQQMDKLIKENAQLKQRTLVSESRRLLVEKTAHMPKEMASFVRSRLENKDPEFIKNNLKYVVEMFERNEEKSKRSALSNRPAKAPVDRHRVVGDLVKEENERQIIQESTNTVADNSHPMMDIYLDGMDFRK